MNTCCDILLSYSTYFKSVGWPVNSIDIDNQIRCSSNSNVGSSVYQVQQAESQYQRLGPENQRPGWERWLQSSELTSPAGKTVSFSAGRYLHWHSLLSNNTQSTPLAWEGDQQVILLCLEDHSYSITAAQSNMRRLCNDNWKYKLYPLLSFIGKIIITLLNIIINPTIWSDRSYQCELLFSSSVVWQQKHLHITFNFNNVT